MPPDISADLLKKTINALIEETFADVKGIYLDKGTSLVETLGTVSAEEASRPITDGGTTIAGHAAHVRFYLDVLGKYMRNELKDRIDWKQSWLFNSVSESDWETLRQGVTDDYKDIQSRLAEIVDWNDEKRLGGALAIIAHTAYHLGAVRQMLRAIKG